MTAPSSERLAQALDAAGLHALARRARNDEFHDFYSPHDAPSLVLDAALARFGAQAALIRAAHHDGEWDATKAESDAWAKSAEGRETFRELLAPVKRERRAEHRRKRQKEAREAKQAAPTLGVVATGVEKLVEQRSRGVKPKAGG